MRSARIDASLATLVASLVAGALAGCGSMDPDALGLKPDLRVNEVVTDNEGVWLDERGEALTVSDSGSYIGRDSGGPEAEA